MSKTITHSTNPNNEFPCIQFDDVRCDSFISFILTALQEAQELLLSEGFSAKLLTGDKTTCLRFHRLLHRLNQKRLAINGFDSPLSEQVIRQLCTRLETVWLQVERQKIADTLQQLPDDPADFIPWFEALEEHGYGQHHRLFDFLAEHANRKEIRYFLQQEYSTEAGFDDLVALTQVKAAPSVKMELAHNYWDEMGRGNPRGVHSFLLQRLGDKFDLTNEAEQPAILWAPLALSNLMIAFASNRCLFYQSMGALGVIELTAPSRCVKVMQAFHRIGVCSEDYHYYTLHSTLDRKHWAGWRDNALHPLIEEAPDSRFAIAEGALLRLLMGQHCFELYAEHLMPDSGKPSVRLEVGAQADPAFSPALQEAVPA